jgi:CheY-like chemotaxis protein
LLVEDDDNHAELVRRNLDRDRIQNTLDHVIDGEEALRYLRAEAPYQDRTRPDVVLLDLKLPKVSGLEVLQAVKADLNLAAIPVVVLTTSDAETDRQRAYELQANSYLMKPIDFVQFRRMVQDLSLYWGVWNRPPQDPSP